MMDSHDEKRGELYLLMSLTALAFILCIVQSASLFKLRVLSFDAVDKSFDVIDKVLDEK